MAARPMTEPATPLVVAGPAFVFAWRIARGRPTRPDVALTGVVGAATLAGGAVWLAVASAEEDDRAATVAPAAVAAALVVLALMTWWLRNRVARLRERTFDR